MGLALSLFFGFIPMFVFAAIAYWADRYEKEPISLLGGMFLWGAMFAAGIAYLINTLMGMGIFMATNSQAATDLATGSLVAPLVEESIKGLAVLVVFLVFRREFDSILDGIIYASIVALGFAATENTYYIYTFGYQQQGLAGLVWLVFMRVLIVGWQHPFYTAFIGIGFSISRLNRRTGIKLIAPLIGWIVAVAAHSAHNTLSNFLFGFQGLAISVLYDWSGWLMMFVFILWAAHREQRWIEHNLQEEVSLGLITPAQYRTACSAWLQSRARLQALFIGRYLATSSFYQKCAELAYKKQQRQSVGEEEGNSSLIELLRDDLKRLSNHAVT